jgi:hypothetical protein
VAVTVDQASIADETIPPKAVCKSANIERAAKKAKGKRE